MDNDQSPDRLFTSLRAARGGALASRIESALSSPIARVRSAAAEIFFDVAVAVLWSDGPLEPTEVKRARGMANALAVIPARGGVFGAIADGALPFSELGFDALEPLERIQLYALARWLIAGNAMGPRRKAFMDGLRARLGLSDAEALRWSATASLYAVTGPSFGHDVAQRSVLALLDAVAGGETVLRVATPSSANDA